MRRLVAITIGVFISSLLLSGVTAWGQQQPQFPGIGPTAEEGAAATESPYALPRSAPTRRPLERAPSAQPSLYADEPVAPALPSAEQPAAAAEVVEQPSETQALAAPPASAPPAPATKPAAALPPASEKTKAAESKSEKNDAKEENASGDETVLSLKLPEFVPQPIRYSWDKLVTVWHYKVFMEVTVEKLSIGLVLLFIGYMAAKRISSWFAARVLGRLGIARNNAATIQTIAFYALMAAFTLSTLGALGVPVTVFSFFGGALAVGIGFGSQNIVNNFISGLILLAERPIRVGDVIQIDGATGKVTEIGARSTRITTGANMEILVPNSTFLQTNVVNWTLSDDVISSKVSVGVAYGSPARQVAALLLKAAQQNADVLAEPAPGVSFTNFGDHALEFELSFWLRLSQSDRGKIESDLRFAIDDLFVEHGIIIAYPQRDVHLNLLRPVEVRLTPPAGELRRAAA